MAAGHLDGFALDERRRGLAESTIERRRYSLCAFERWLGRSVLTATTDEVQRFLDGRGLSARGRYAWLSNLHCFYRWAVGEGLVDVDPCAVIVRPRLPRLLPRPVSDEQLARAIRLVSPAGRVAVCLAAFGGLRCCELAGLERGDLDLASGTMRVLGKGSVERRVPIHPVVLVAIDRARLPHVGRLLRRRDGRAHSGGSMSRWLGQELRGAGVDASAHQLRHWFGTATYRSSGDLRVVQELLGHASPTTTAVYVAWSPVAAQAAVRSLAVPCA